MIIIENKRSRKFFIVIDETRSDFIKIVTPEDQIKTVRRSLFQNMIDGDGNTFIKSGKITELQYEVYKKYMEWDQRKTLSMIDISPRRPGHNYPPPKDNIKSTGQIPIYREGRPMKKIKIDEEVYDFLQKKAIPFEETPNDVLRRLLRLGKKNIPKPPPVGSIGTPKKTRKADLATLVEIEVLHEGQILTLNYKNETLSQKYQARISRNWLLYEAGLYTMSGLVAEILDREEKGIPSRAYRGPEYWYNSNGISVRELWEQYLRG